MTHNGLRVPNAKELLQPAQALVQDSLFWSHQSDGLAVFFSEEGFRQYSLPFNFDELVVVADRFHLKPMLPILSGDGRFYVLALSQNQVRLLQGTRYSVDDLDLDGIPQGLEEALRPDTPERQIQWPASPQGGTGKGAPAFHGHGGGTDDPKENIFQYLRQVDKGLHDLIGNDNAPLVLAAVDYLFPIYKEANTYAHLLEQGIPGNPEGLTAQQLHAQAWNVIEPHFQKAQQDAVSQYNQIGGHRQNIQGPRSYSTGRHITAEWRCSLWRLECSAGDRSTLIPMRFTGTTKPNRVMKICSISRRSRPF